MTWRAFIQLLVTLLGLSGVKADALPAVEHGVSRRAFLRALGVSVAVLAAMPASFALDEALDLEAAVPDGFDLVRFDSLLKEIYAPLILEQLNQPNAILQVMEADNGIAREAYPVQIGRNWAVATRPR